MGIDTAAGIDKQGSAWLRRGRNQAVQTAKRSPQFAASYQAIARRCGTKIATIAIARKPLTRACHLLAGAQAAQALDTASTDTTPPHAGRVGHPAPGTLAYAA